MNILDKKNYYNSLFDYYGKLLTPKQQEYFKNYYFEDLSLAEIANIHDVSRNAIHDQLNKIYQILDNYEEKLQLHAKSIKLNEIIDEFSKIDDENIKRMIAKIRSVE
ncbi:MAG TPA: hypothetical protein GXZ48_01520 [Acholeplasmataceae bacterium]|jgi:predicted DNA-binding protein YlxM (UPF0122 family)|nr:hypothetical protein [Acholeplasmataceae bacterium]